MIRAVIITPWSAPFADRFGGWRAPRVSFDFTLESCRDATNQRMRLGVPSPNLLVVEVQADATTVDAIEAHPSYTGAVIFRDDTRPETGSFALSERTAIRARLVAGGVAAAEVVAAIPPGRRRTATDTLIAYLKSKELAQ